MFVNDQQNEKKANKIFYSCLTAVTLVVMWVGLIAHGV